MSTLVKKIETFDIFLASLLVSRRRLSLTRVMTIVTRIGDGQFWVLLSLLIAAVYPQGSIVLSHLAIAFSFELTVYKIAKFLLPRLRPCDFLPKVTQLVMPPDRYSFPSGHTAAAFVMVTVLAHFAPMLALLMLPLALLIGFSRLYLGVHYLTDVVAGAALGLVSGKIALWVGLYLTA